MRKNKINFIFKYLYYITFPGTLCLYLFIVVNGILINKDGILPDFVFKWLLKWSVIFIPCLMYSLKLKSRFFTKNLLCIFWLFYFLASFVFVSNSWFLKYDLIILIIYVLLISILYKKLIKKGNK